MPSHGFSCLYKSCSFQAIGIGPFCVATGQLDGNAWIRRRYISNVRGATQLLPYHALCVQQQSLRYR